MVKECFKCGVVKDISDFYKHSRMRDGHLNKCKQCTKSDASTNYKGNMQNHDFVLKERVRNKSRNSGSASIESRRKWLSDNLFKKHAMNAAQHIKCPDGCERHHWSYNEEHYKDVIIIPESLHRKLHKFMFFDHDSKKFKTIEGTLLDTKEKHLSFLQVVKAIF